MAGRHGVVGGTTRLALLAGALLSVVGCSPTAPPAAAPTTAAAPTSKPAAPGAAAAGLSTAVLANYRPDPPLDPPLTVKVAFFGVVPDGAYALGQQRGYFAAEGIILETTRFSSSTDALPAVSQGEIDAYGASPNPALFNAIGRGVNLQVLGPISTTVPGRDPNGVIVRQDLIDSGRYKTLSDLKGMKIAVGTAFSTSNYALKAAVEKGGLSLKDMDVSAIGVPNILPALANKAVEAAASTEPSLTQAEQQGFGKVVARLLDVAPPEKAAAGNGVLVASPAFLKKPGVDRFMIAWVRSEFELDAALSSPDMQVQDAIVKLLNENGVNVAIGVQQGTFPAQAERSTVGLQTLLDWYREDGAVTTAIDVNKVANYELLGRAYERLGAGGGNR